MKKIINKPENFVDEMLSGILKAHSKDFKKADQSLREIVRKDAPVEDKVAIATGGGSGHLPVFLGYVGHGLCDGCAVGNVFASPSAAEMYNVTKAIDSGKGVLYLYGNYGGDVMNFDMAAEMAAADGIEVKTVLVRDDLATGEDISKRRGVAGLFYAYKIAGAAAEKGLDLDEVVVVTEKALANTRSLGIALSPCVIPESQRPTFTIEDDEMELGMGIHGEPGIERTELKTADKIAEIMIEKILADGPYQSGDEISILVNSLGATPKEELYIIYNKVADLLAEKEIKVYRKYIGEYATSMEMAGMSITVIKLDEELKSLLDAPAYSPFFEQSDIVNRG
ncbi:dihydroxyacetone kinase subunit DhaK [Halanaerobium kushneri]|uniref:Dihydroxyacetone kinase, N-terminal domain n=1 Tax=Halanaerobium kushneri TaxID=56779 RepID=A0A1N6S0W2_9FIRM|nr:dihydroxyacetone kinase subunit DhaK [Halanaerobium kushneri]SIQ34763.1 dihydroxyacetone kinase, N-terminal domain [Halanaerobium kushneri]